MTIAYGWIGNQELYDLLKNEFNDDHKKSLNQLLTFKIETKNINVKSGFNKILPKDYDDLKKKENLSMNELTLVDYFETKYSVFNKLRFLQKLVDNLNYKYGINLKVSFVKSFTNKYQFVLFFDNFYSDGSSIVNEQLQKWFQLWDRLKSKSSICTEPSMLSLKCI